MRILFVWDIVSLTAGQENGSQWPINRCKCLRRCSSDPGRVQRRILTFHLVLALAYVFSSLRATRHALHRRELPQASVFIAAPGTEVGTTQVVAWAFPMHVSGREVLSLVVNV